MNYDFYSKSLVNWYKEHRRDLPWRRSSDPYIIWISEIILQQTRVAQGLDYFNRFIARFPDVRALATASEDEVLRYWQGLGYYSRARNLLEAARTICRDFGGIFPRTYNEVRSLKGIGDYTAAAIVSFAYDLPYPVLDGNVYRVLARLFALSTPIDSTRGKKEFAELAGLLLDKEHPGLHNQAIMELGALQCVPRLSIPSNNRSSRLVRVTSIICISFAEIIPIYNAVKGKIFGKVSTNFRSSRRTLPPISPSYSRPMPSAASFPIVVVWKSPWYYATSNTSFRIRLFTLRSII